MKIPGKGRILKYLNRTKSEKLKNLLWKSRFKLINQDYHGISTVEVSLVSFSGKGGLLDQILSISSFINSVGIPIKWSIYSDGSHNADEISLLKTWEFVKIEVLNKNVKWQLNKFHAFSNYLVDSTTLFLDSDILFFKPFKEYLPYFKNSNWILPENKYAQSLDDGYLNFSFQYLTSINRGFFILNKNIDWSSGKSYLEEKKNKNNISHFTEQTAINIIFEKESNMKILDPRYFLLTTSDHFKIVLDESSKIAMRHYVGLIRHKMYLSFMKNYGYLLK
jgi:hypothetical protein